MISLSVQRHCSQRTVDCFIAWMLLPHSGVLFTLASHIVKAKWSLGKRQIDAKQTLLYMRMAVCSPSVSNSHTYNIVHWKQRTKCHHALLLLCLQQYQTGQDNMSQCVFLSFFFFFKSDPASQFHHIFSSRGGSRQEGRSGGNLTAFSKMGFESSCNKTGLFFK